LSRAIIAARQLPKWRKHAMSLPSRSAVEGGHFKDRFMTPRAFLISGAALMVLGGAFLASTGASEAKGCLKGALVGGVAGHYAGHHTVLGAVGGCIAGHHLAKTADKKKQEQSGQPASDASPATPMQPAQ
jgi:hypothetical protein